MQLSTSYLNTAARLNHNQVYSTALINITSKPDNFEKRKVSPSQAITPQFGIIGMKAKIKKTTLKYLRCDTLADVYEKVRGSSEAQNHGTGNDKHKYLYIKASDQPRIQIMAYDNGLLKLEWTKGFWGTRTFTFDEEEQKSDSFNYWPIIGDEYNLPK